MTAVAEPEVQSLEVTTSAPKKCPIVVTERALSEVKRIVAEQEGTEKHYLRVRITGGGCSGFKPKLDLDLTGAEVDFVDNITGGGFTIKNPNAKSTCGCGSSFNV